MENDLQKWYKTLESKYDYMPPFEKLTDEQKQKWENSLSFATWKVGELLRQFWAEIKNEFKIW